MRKFVGIIQCENAAIFKIPVEYISHEGYRVLRLFTFNPAGHAGHHFDSELPWVSPQLEPYEQLLYELLLLSQPCSHIGLCHPPRREVIHVELDGCHCRMILHDELFLCYHSEIVISNHR